MPRRCTICRHPQHEEIAVSLFRDGTRATARRSEMSLPTFDRHKSHLPGAIVKAQQAEVACEATPKVKSHAAVNCAIYTRDCQDVCELACTLQHDQRDACKALVPSQR